MQKQLCCSIMMFLLIQAGAGVAQPATSKPVGLHMPIPEGDHKTHEPLKPASESQVKLSRAQLIETQRDIQGYRDAIRLIESQEGAYGNAITEKLGSLGAALQYTGKHNEAIKIFKRGIHLSRINDGLYTTDQIPMLERLIASLTAKGDWKQVSDRYHYLEWLNIKNYGKNDLRILPAYNQLSKWHLRAYTMQFGRDNEAVTDHLIAAHTMIEKSIALLENTEHNEARLVEELNGLTLTNYLFATFQRSSVQKMQMHNPEESQRRQMRQSAQAIDQYINRSFRAGKDAINRVIHIHANNKDSPQWSVAKAKVIMGDWLFMFNKRNAAFVQYQEAWEILTQDESGLEEIKKIFDQPVALPNFDLMETNNYNKMEQATYDGENRYVLASFDVTALGKAANIEIIESKPPNSISARSQVKKSLRIAKFRPRFVAGTPTLTEKIQLRVLSR